MLRVPLHQKAWSCQVSAARAGGMTRLASPQAQNAMSWIVCSGGLH